MDANMKLSYSLTNRHVPFVNVNLNSMTWACMKVVILFRLWLVGSILRQSLGDSGDRIGLVETDMNHHTNYNNPFLSQNHYPYFLRLIDQWLINSNKFDLLMKLSYATNGYTMYVLVAFIYKAQPYFFAMTLKTKINNSQT